MDRSARRELLGLALWMIASQLIGYAPQIIDTVMAGWHSPLTQAGVGLAMQIYSFIFLFMLGIMIAVSPSTARALGAGDEPALRRSFQQGLWLAALLALLSALLTVLAAQVPTWIGSTPAVAAEAKRYLLTLLPGAALAIFALAGRYFLEGMAMPRSNILIQVALIPVNILGNYVLLKGVWIFPALGAQGLAVATDFALLLYASLLFFAIAKNPRFARLRLFRHFPRPDGAKIAALLTVGLPIAAAIVMEGGLFNVIGLIVSRSTAAQTAANQIAINFSGTLFMIPLGLSSVMTTLCSRNYGRRDFEAIAHTARIGLFFTVLMMLSIAALVVALRHPLAALYTTAPAIAHLSAQLFGMVALFQIADGVQVVAAGVLRGLHDTRSTMYFAALGYWVVGFPVALVFAYLWNYGLMGLWAGLALGVFINAALASLRVLSLTRKLQLSGS